MNPVPHAHGLKLNASDRDNALDLGLARAVAQYFRIGAREADEIIVRGRRVVAQWPRIADGLRIPAREQARMAPAFRLATAN